jgi:hypothetical protein
MLDQILGPEGRKGMTRQGRAHRGYRAKRTKPMKNGNHAHRDKNARRQESRKRRHEAISELLTVAEIHCDLSRRGLAWSRGAHYRGEEFINRDGRVVLKTWRLRAHDPRQVAWSTPWDKLHHLDLSRLTGREDWVPYKPKSPLVLLAELAAS